MQCPFCGKNVDKVIDSRPTKDGIGIYRRRECLACARRFTTYESTEERIIPVLTWRRAGREATIRSFRKMISFMSGTFKDLTEGMEALIDKVDKLESSSATKRPKTKVSRKKPKTKTTRRKRAKKSPVKKTAAKKRAIKTEPAKKIVAKRAGKVSVADTVFGIIRRSGRGVDTATLKKKTGFSDKKIWNTINSLKRQGKVRSDRIGVYMKA